MSFFSSSPPSPVLRMDRRRAVPLSDYDLDDGPESPILSSGMRYPRSSTPIQKMEHIFPEVLILPPPSTPSNYETLSPILRIDRPNSVPLSDYDLDDGPESPILSSSIQYPRSSTPVEKIELFPEVIILPQPLTPINYATSLSLESSEEEGFDVEKLQITDPNNTIVSLLSTPSNYISSFSPRTAQMRVQRDFDELLPSPQEISSKYFSDNSQEFISPTSKRRNKITIDTDNISKKIKLWDDQETSAENSSPVLSNRKSTIDKLRREHEEKNMSNSLENPILIPEITINRKTSSIHPRQETDISIVSFNSMSIRLSPMRSDDREMSEDFLEITNVKSPSPYFSSNTSLWDLPVNSELSYSVQTPSDSTGDEDYSIVFERRCQTEIQRKKQMKLEEQQRQVAKQEARRSAFQEFFIEGITWSFFSPDKISFSIKPKERFPDYFSSKKKYSFSMIYTGKYWTIKTFRVPRYKTILKQYSRVEVTDSSIEYFLKFVVSTIHRYIELEKEIREDRAADFYSGNSMDLNSSDVELWLNEDQKKQYKEKCERLWRGMMSPDII